MTQLQPRLKAALVWRLVALLHRRHQAPLGLRLIQADPGVGRGDVLGLFRQDDQRLVVGFDLVGGAMVSAGPLGPPRSAPALGLRREAPARWAYPAFLAATPPAKAADHVEALLGLPRGGAPDDRSVPALVFDTLAELLWRTATSPAGVVVRCGWQDRAGGAGSSQAPWTAPFLDHAPYGPAELPAGVPWSEAAAEVAHLWGLLPARPPEGPVRPIAVVSSATGVVHDPSGGARGSLWRRFEKGEGPRGLAWRLERLFSA